MIHVYVSSAGKEVRPGAIGKAVPGYVAKVVDQDLNPVPNGTVGRLAVKGPTGCRYLDDARQKVFVQKGWNLPGDTFRMDDDGYRSEEHKSELQSLMRSTYDVFGWKKKKEKPK